MGSEGVQDSLGYLPEILTVVADTASTACPPGMQPCQPHQPRVQLIAHSGAETASVGSQHLCAPTASEPADWERAVSVAPAPPPTAYNPAIARAQVHQLSRTASQQRQHVLHLPHTRPNIGHLGKETCGWERRSPSATRALHTPGPLIGIILVAGGACLLGSFLRMSCPALPDTGPNSHPGWPLGSTHSAHHNRTQHLNAGPAPSPGPAHRPEPRPP